MTTTAATTGATVSDGTLHAATRRTGDIGRHEIAAYAEAAKRGDVLPACMRLVAARVRGAWADRASMALVVGPACRADALEMACAFMPRAVEPRLLRASASIAAARAARAPERAAWISAARRDLEDAARLDPSDATVGVLLSELTRVARADRRARAA